MPIGKQTPQQIQEATISLATKLENLESQYQDVPPGYTIAGGFLVDDTLVGATQVNLNTFPAWAENTAIFLVIDAGTVQCEVRKVTTISGTLVNFTTPLTYAHSARDPVLFSSDAIINPAWFGAMGDGVTVDTAAFQAACSELLVIGGGIFRIPAGTYILNQNINISTGAVKYNISVIGSGRDQTILQFTQTDGTSCLTATIGGHIAIVDLQVKGTKTSSGTRRAISLTNCDYVTIFRVKSQDHDASGLYITGSMIMTTVAECYFYNNGANYSVEIVLLSGTLYFVNSDVVGNSAGTGLYITDTDNVFILNNYFRDNLYYGLLIASGVLVTVSGNVFYGNASGAGSEGCLLSLIQQFTVTGNVFYGAVVGWGCLILECSYGSVSGNSSGGNFLGGISVYTGTSILVGDNASNETPRVGIYTPVSGVKVSSRHTEWIPAEDWEVVAGGAAVTATTLGAANDSPRVWSFNSTVNAAVGVWWRVPGNLFGAGLNVLLRIYYTTIDAGAGNMELFATSYNAAIGVACNTVFSAVNVVVTPGGLNYTLYTYDLLTFTASGAIWWPPPIGTANGGDVLRLRVGRNGAQPNDNYGNNMLFLGAELIFE